MRQRLGVCAVWTIAFALATSFVLCAQAQKPFPTPPAELAGGPDLAGTWVGTYKSNRVPSTSVTLIFQQWGTTVTGTYLSANGAQGVISGNTGGPGEANLSAEQKTPTCQGQFNMSAKVSGTALTWQFVGKDCLGSEAGSGTAARQPASGSKGKK